MGVVKKTVVDVTCDVCKQACGESDGEVSIQVHGGDGRDVGPTYIYGTLRFHNPYVCDKGIVCKKCKFEWLSRYAGQLAKEQS